MAKAVLVMRDGKLPDENNYSATDRLRASGGAVHANADKAARKGTAKASKSRTPSSAAGMRSIYDVGYRDLQKLCKRRGIRAIGKTEALKKRLMDYDRKHGAPATGSQPDAAPEGPSGQWRQIGKPKKIRSPAYHCSLAHSS